jgi:hypothetical protein
LGSNIFTSIRTKLTYFQRKKRAEKLLEQAKQLENNEVYKGAIILVQDAIKIFPEGEYDSLLKTLSLKKDTQESKRKQATIREKKEQDRHDKAVNQLVNLSVEEIRELSDVLKDEYGIEPKEDDIQNNNPVKVKADGHIQNAKEAESDGFFQTAVQEVDKAIDINPNGEYEEYRKLLQKKADEKGTDEDLNKTAKSLGELSQDQLKDEIEEMKKAAGSKLGQSQIDKLNELGSEPIENCKLPRLRSI